MTSAVGVLSTAMFCIFVILNGAKRSEESLSGVNQRFFGRKGRSLRMTAQKSATCVRVHYEYGPRAKAALVDRKEEACTV